jgi:hypothetical protein
MLTRSHRGKIGLALLLMACLMGHAGLACFAEQSSILPVSQTQAVLHGGPTTIAVARPLSRTRTVPNHKNAYLFLAVWLAWKLWFDSSSNLTAQAAVRVPTVFLLTIRGRSPPQFFLV